jgi:hypothetical protein
MIDIFLYEGEPNPNDIRLSNPTAARTQHTSVIADGGLVVSGSALVHSSLPQHGIIVGESGVVVGGTAVVIPTYVVPVIIVEPPIVGGELPSRPMFFMRGHGGAILRGSACVSFVRKRTFIYRPKRVHIEGQGGIEIGGSSFATVHVHQEQQRVAAGGCIAQGSARVTTYTHQTLQRVGDGGGSLRASTTIHTSTHATLDIVGKCELIGSAAASVDAWKPHILDISGSGNAFALGHASVDRYTRQTLSYKASGGVTIAGDNQIIGIVDSLTDEELIFLLEVA